MNGKIITDFSTPQGWRAHLIDYLKTSVNDIGYEFIITDPVSRANNIKLTPDMTLYSPLGQTMGTSLHSTKDILNRSFLSDPVHSHGIVNASLSDPFRSLNVNTTAPSTRIIKSTSTLISSPETTVTDKGKSERNKRKLDETDLVTQEQDTKKLKELSECSACELTCRICYNYFIEPRTLQCGCTFCKRCLYESLHGESAKQDPNSNGSVGKYHCPACKKVSTKKSHKNKSLEFMIESHIKITSPGSSALYEDRKRLMNQKFDEDLAKLHTMIENAKARRTKFLNIKDRWKLEEKRTFRKGVGQYFGKCREDYCILIGLTKTYCENCTYEELIIACDNLEIPVVYSIVGIPPGKVSRIVDFSGTRERLIDFWNADDNMF